MYRALNSFNISGYPSTVLIRQCQLGDTKRHDNSLRFWVANFRRDTLAGRRYRNALAQCGE